MDKRHACTVHKPEVSERPGNYIAERLPVCVSCKRVARVTFVIYICSFVVSLARFI